MKPYKGRPVTAFFNAIPRPFTSRYLVSINEYENLLLHFPAFTTLPAILQGLKTYLVYIE